MKAVILAGGKGKRLRPLTLETPKPLLTIKDRTILEYIIDYLKGYGITDLIITIGYKGHKIREFFGDGSRFGVRIEYSEEREPLVDVIEDKDTITVVAEVPGVSKEDIDVKIKGRTLIISAASGDRKYYKEVELPTDVKPETAKASYRNGVLEVKIKKVKEEAEEGFKIKVE